MLFNSLTYLLFLPVTLAVFVLVPVRWRWAWLVVASYVYYAAIGAGALFYLGAITLVVWLVAQGISQSTDPRLRTSWLVAGLVLVLGSLFAFKFYDFLAVEVERLAASSAPVLPRLDLKAPAGFSFYAFAAASYLIDTYARNVEPQPQPGHIAFYLAYFPKLLAGPIERATTLLPKLHAGPVVDTALLVPGLQLIVWGLFKKVVIADNLAPLVDRSFAIAVYASPMELLLAIYFFTFQIYCDFSGYTDIAIGTSLLFGIRLMENFRRPYLSRSTAEFWRDRWHISLGRWFRDYLYVPLGGNRRGSLRRYAGIMTVFVVSGLWHAGLGYGVGWTFVVWGALNGLYQWAGMATRHFWRGVGDRWPRLETSLPVHVLRVVLTFHLIAISWVFFRAQSIADAVTVLMKIANSALEIPGLLARYPFSTEQYWGMGLIAFLIMTEILDERRPVFEWLGVLPKAIRWGVYYAGIFALLLIGRWQGQQFIYMQF
jgi:D-alanyl-lipoteichoic acid acyltransferase DltB (MBOAT superfamily)